MSIPRFQQSIPLVEADGRPTQAFHMWWDTVAKNIESQLDSINSALAAIQALQTAQAAQLVLIEQAQTDIVAVQADQASQLALIEAAQTDIIAVQTAQAAQLTQILAAQAAADAVHLNDSISASWTSPGSVLSASDAGTSASIAIASHTRKYGDGTQLTGISAGSLTGLAYSTVYYVYYDDSTRASTSPVYHSSTNPNDALPNAAIGRHSLGFVTTPASGGGATTGGYTPPGGYSGPGQIP